MYKYRLISKKGEGTFSEVLKAQSIKTGKYVAIKCMKNYFSSLEQVNSLREIQALRRLSPNPQIIKFYEILYDEPTGRLALVFELMDMNLYELMRSYKTEIPEYKVRNFIYQVLKALDHMHRNGIFHRDIKPENVLVADDIIKLADFGSCRGIHSKQPYTEYISTRWYRPPECLLTDGYYGGKMDLWGVGCVFFELLTTNPLFPGENEFDQISLIHKILGTPSAEVFEEFEKQTKTINIDFKPVVGTGIDKLLPAYVSEHAKDLMKLLLTYKAEDRISTKQALRHPYFKDIRSFESPIRSSPSPHSLRFFDADRAAGDDEKIDNKLPLIKNTAKKLSDTHNISQTTLADKTSCQTKNQMQENKKKQISTYKKNIYKSLY
ncbi:hypothetical protein SteCoe_27786 [Stentor coeruleus]|uniref:Protein kinase domain-containing protein n=1 Tax=Stentor coeruleus TaxID=5963 RepID=A0A1R2BA07_9CILI|nr:hypothetical protein SteCoe_27786 [Stentor coeruleus]